MPLVKCWSNVLPHRSTNEHSHSTPNEACKASSRAAPCRERRNNTANCGKSPLIQERNQWTHQSKLVIGTLGQHQKYSKRSKLAVGGGMKHWPVQGNRIRSVASLSELSLFSCLHPVHYGLHQQQIRASITKLLYDRIWVNMRPRCHYLTPAGSCSC